MAIVIKNFGNDTTCKNETQLKQALLTKYTSTSVTIISTLPSGIKKSLFVDVQSNGTLIGTYCKTPFPLSRFNFLCK